MLRKLIKILTSRIVVLALLLIVQVAFLFISLYRTALSYSLVPLFDLLARILAIYVINKDEDSQYKIGWIFLILALPVLGSFLFLLCFGRKMPKRLANGTIRADARLRDLLKQDPETLQNLKENDPECAYHFLPGVHVSGFPVYQNTRVEYYDSGEAFLPAMLEELKQAKHFIFMEYYIIQTGTMWNQVLDVLKQKVEEGVEVKLIYDDFGCYSRIPAHYDRELNQMGIETYRFNKMRPALVITMNNRDHRKLCVIDNRIGFTGGVNLADEYININSPYGYWRDSAMKMEGEAVTSLTVMFLGMFSYLRKDENEIDYTRYIGVHRVEQNKDCWYQPFSDTPTDEIDMGLSVHLNLVNSARRYIYIDTPYLVLNSDMLGALCLSARNGTDVRIMTPGIPDKQTVFQITRSNYYKLIKAGVKIYEYTPGFNHRKNVVADDMCLIGTVNTDYRSYFLQFENGVLMHDPHMAETMRRAFEAGLEQAEQITLEKCQSVNGVVRLYRAILALMAPLF
ncbi:MAG: cardiolipin synthase [Solobacterium sp.]|nr:cardiolipin synthase [Solobacterium sp.]